MADDASWKVSVSCFGRGFGVSLAILIMIPINLSKIADTD